MIVTGLCCYAFFLFRTGSAREQSLTDAMKIIRAATEIVSSMAERGLPNIRTRLEELESRGRVLEQHQRVVERTLGGLAVASSGGGGEASVVEVPPHTDQAMLAARKAARAMQQGGTP